MTAQPLPHRPNLEFYRKQAKQFLKACQAAEPSALERLRKHHPHAARLLAPGATIVLADAQVVIAREHGHSSWTPFKEELERALQAEESAAKGFIDDILRGNAQQVEAFLAVHGPLSGAIAREAEQALTRIVDRSVGHRPQFHRIAKALVGTGVPCSIWVAARVGLLDHVRQWVARDRALLNAKDEHGRTALQRAALVYGAHAECAQVVAWLVSEGATVDIFSASTYGVVDVVRAELSRDPGLARATAQGGTALHWAVRPRLHLDRANADRAMEICRLLIAAGAALDAPDLDEDSMQPLHHVGEWGNDPELACLLLDSGVDLNAKAANGWTPLDYALDRDRKPMVAFLKSRGAVQTLPSILPDAIGQRALLLAAAQRGDVEAARELLRAEPTLIDSKDEEGHGLLYVASMYGFNARRQDHRAFVEFLIEAGAEVDLHAAAFLARPERVREILSKSLTSLNRTAPPYEGTALHCAAERGDLATVRALVEGGADLNVRDKIGRTPLHVAAHAGPWKPEAAGDVIDYLVEHGARMDVFSAAALGNIELLERMAARGDLELDARDTGGCTALWHAARNNRIDAVRWLVAHGTSVHAANADGQTALSTAILHFLPHKADPALILHLLEHGASPGAESVAAETAFLVAAVDGKQAEAERVLSEHPALPALSACVASMLGESDLVSAALKRDAALATRRGGPKNWDPLLYLCFSRFHRNHRERGTGITRIAKLLLAHGADPNTAYTWEQDEKNKLPALWAATSEANHPALARVLLEAGANPDDSESIYHCAEKYHVECLELLHAFGATLSGPFLPWNNTPLYFILGYHRSSGSSDAAFQGMCWLLDHGADPNVPSYESQERPIHLAATNGWGVELLELLAKHGADLNARRRDGKTAYDLAVRRGNTEAVDWLRAHAAAETVSVKDEFLGACARGDARSVRAVLAREPDVWSSLDVEERGLLHSVASEGRIEAVRVMLEAGWSVDTRGSDGATPLHWACWFGQLDVVRLLLALGAPVNVEDTTYHSTPLGHAVHGSQHCQNPRGDYPAIVEALYAAGGQRTGGLYGSEEVRAVLKRQGVVE